MSAAALRTHAGYLPPAARGARAGFFRAFYRGDSEQKSYTQATAQVIHNTRPLKYYIFTGVRGCGKHGGVCA